jgi:integral membrane sensor domain MASE1
MIYREDKRSGTTFPIIVILIAMVAIVGSLALSPGNQRSARIWIPASTVDR